MEVFTEEHGSVQMAVGCKKDKQNGIYPGAGRNIEAQKFDRELI